MFFLKHNPLMRERDLRRLRGAPLSVYIGLADHMNWDGESFPSLETLSQETGYKVRRVEEALHFLKEEGLITPVRARRGHATVYRVNHWFCIGRNGTDALFEKTYALECRGQWQWSAIVLIKMLRSYGRKLKSG